MKSFITNVTSVKRILSKAIACLAASALIATAAAVPVSTNAATNNFITRLDDGSGITIDSGQLKSYVYMPMSSAYNFTLKERTNYIESVGTVITNPGTMMILKLTVKGVTKNAASNLGLSVNPSYYNNGRTTDVYRTLNLKPTNIQPNSNSTYTLTYKFESYGNRLTFKTATVSGLKYVSSELKDDPDFISVDVRGPEGYEAFVAAVPNVSGLSKSKLAGWGRNNCLFINSLSDMTGIKKNTIFVEFNGSGSCNLAQISPNYFDQYALVSLDSVATDALISYIKDWDRNHPVLIQEELHEYSHAYALDYNRFANANTSHAGYDSELTTQGGYNYRRNNFSNFYNMNLDDIFTNVRGAAAIQHCKDLRNKLIISNTSKKGAAGTFTGSYDTYLQLHLAKIDAAHPGWRTSANVVNDFRAHWFNAALANLAVERNAWGLLKEFFKGTAPQNITTAVYSNFGKYLFGNNSTQFNGVNWNLSYKLSYPGNISHVEEKLKLVNTTYKIWQLFDYQSSYNQYAFEAFVNNYFDKALLKSFVN